MRSRAHREPRDKKMVTISEETFKADSGEKGYTKIIDIYIHMNIYMHLSFVWSHKKMPTKMFPF